MPGKKLHLARKPGSPELFSKARICFKNKTNFLIFMEFTNFVKYIGQNSAIFIRNCVLWCPVSKFETWLRRSPEKYFCIFLAHLSRRLTRWAYSIAMVRRPSVVVRRRPHFQTCISLKPAGQPRSNFMCSITGVGERLHKVLGQIRLKLWFPWQQKAPIDL